MMDENCGQIKLKGFFLSYLLLITSRLFFSFLQIFKIYGQSHNHTWLKNAEGLPCLAEEKESRPYFNLSNSLTT